MCMCRHVHNYGHTCMKYQLHLNCFHTVYLLEIILKLIALGPVDYFRSYWNV